MAFQARQATVITTVPDGLLGSSIVLEIAGSVTSALTTLGPISSPTTSTESSTSTSVTAGAAPPPNPISPTTTSTTSTTPTSLATPITSATASTSDSSVTGVPNPTSSSISPITSALAAAGNATSSGTTTQSSNSTGLIAGVAVLGALLALALAAIVFLLWRRRRSKDAKSDYGAAYEPKAAQDRPANVTNLENTVNDLETQLHQKDAQLRDSHAALLQHGRRSGIQGLNDRQLNERFARLSKSINDWVVTHFKTIRPGVQPVPNVENTVRSVFPNYDIFLQDPRTKYLVIRGLVAEIIFQAYSTGELLGNEAFMELKQAVASSSSSAELNEWRAQTATFLEKTPGYRADKASSVQEVSKKIDYMTSNLAGLEYAEARQHHLIQVVETAAGLAMEIAKHPSTIKIQKPSGTTFDALYMEDVLQDHQGEVVQGKPIQGVVFPSVVKIADGQDEGNGYIISKAQVLV